MLYRSYIRKYLSASVNIKCLLVFIIVIYNAMFPRGLRVCGSREQALSDCSQGLLYIQ